jgi:hypothetical protein
MTSLELFLKNKKVIIIGPSESLLLNKNKDFIESFDIIVRVNRGIEPTDKYADYIGNRTDILYNCLYEHPDNGGIINIDYFNQKKLKYLVYHPRVDFNGKSINKDPISNAQNALKKLKKSNIQLNRINSDFYNSISSQVKCRPNTGYIAIFDLLNYDIKELYITGFTFYMDNFMPGYKDHVNKEKFKNKCFTSKRHNQNNLWNFLKKNYNNNPKIKVDKYLDKILKLEELDLNKKKFIFS